MTRTRASDRYSSELTAQMGSTDLAATVLTTAGSPASPCMLVIDHDVAAKAEIVLFDGTFDGTTFRTSQLANRYRQGSAAGSGITHDVGAKVIFAALGSHHEEIHDELDAHEAASSVHGAVSTSTANTLALRDASARFRAASPSNTADVATKGYVDSADSTLTSADSTHAALTSPHSAVSSATAARLVVRDGAARAQFASPSATGDAATKGYVDGQIGGHDHGAPVWTRIATFTPSGSSSVTWSSIPQTYQHLWVVGRIGHNGGSTYHATEMTVNNRSGTSYASVQSNAPGDWTTAGVDTDEGSPAWFLWTGNNGTVEVFIPNYTSTASPIVARAQYFATYSGSGNGIRLEENGMRENGSGPVTRIDMSLANSGVQFRAGTMLSLYGVT